jgi:hypothetical protein
MIAAAARVAQHEHPLLWQWPIDLSAYDQRPRLMRRGSGGARSPSEVSPATRALGAVVSGRAGSLRAARPRCVRLPGHSHAAIALLDSACPRPAHAPPAIAVLGWSEDTWHAIVGTSRGQGRLAGCRGRRPDASATDARRRCPLPNGCQPYQLAPDEIRGTLTPYYLVSADADVSQSPVPSQGG